MQNIECHYDSSEHNELHKTEHKQNENDADMVIPNLWLGNKHAALNEQFIRKFNIKYIVNVTDGIRSPFPFVTYYNLPISDKKMCDDNLRSVMFNYIKSALTFISDGLRNGEGVLVHCRKGHHRSANIVLLFLMEHLKIGYIPAMIFINNLRPYALKRNTCVNKWILNYYNEHIKDFINK